MGNNRYADDEPEDMEEVAQFIVELQWGPDGYYGNGPFPTGLQTVSIVIEGVATSTDAIIKAKEMLASVRADEPRTTKAELKTSKRRIPKKIANNVLPIIDA